MGTIEAEVAVKQEPEELDSTTKEVVSRVNDKSGLPSLEERKQEGGGGGGSESESRENLKQDGVVGEESNQSSREEQSQKGAFEPPAQKGLGGRSTQKRGLVSGGGKQISKKYKKLKYEDNSSFANSTSVQDVRPFSGFVLFANDLSRGECVTT